MSIPKNADLESESSQLIFEEDIYTKQYKPDVKVNTSEDEMNSQRESILSINEDRTEAGSD
jgi:hypothetical protein